jgi:uncharacterized membrane protein YhaH (DUF805 family)
MPIADFACGLHHVRCKHRYTNMSLHVGDYLVIVNPVAFIAALICLIAIVTTAIALIRILQRAGYSGWWVLVGLVPGLNLAGLWYFAFGPWPALDPNRVSDAA